MVSVVASVVVKSLIDADLSEIDHQAGRQRRGRLIQVGAGDMTG
jgi:hypothetical protein